MRLVLVSFTLIYSCIIIPIYETLHDRPFSVTSEEILRDSDMALSDILAWEGESAWCLSGPLKRLAAGYLKEKHGRLRTTRYFQHQYLRTRGQETLYETCSCIIDSH